MWLIGYFTAHVGLLYQIFIFIYLLVFHVEIRVIGIQQTWLPVWRRNLSHRYYSDLWVEVYIAVNRSLSRNQVNSLVREDSRPLCIYELLSQHWIKLLLRRKALHVLHINGRF